MTNKIYALLALAILMALAVTAGIRYNSIVEERDALKIVNKQMEDVINTERNRADIAESSRDKYLKERDEKNDEINNLKSRVTDRTTVLRVPAKCPAAKAGPDTSGTPAASPELEEYARPAYYAHIDDESKVISLLNMCVRQLKIDRGLE